MTQQVLDALADDIKRVLQTRGISSFDVEAAFLAGDELRAEREATLGTLVSAEVTKGQPYDLLLLFDVVAATASSEAAGVGAAPGTEPVASDVIDLWINATAARALWYERFVQWPNENGAKKLGHLVDTARKLGAESIARALLEGAQPFKFTEFVGRLSRISAT